MTDDTARALAIAVAQFAPTADRDENLSTIGALARRAAERGASLVVFPEYSSRFTPEPGPLWLEHAESLDGPFVTALSSLADEIGVHLVAGFVEKADGERVSNTLVAIAPERGVVATYRKLHLYDAFGQKESEWVLPGDIDEPETFDVDGLRIGLQTCYDVRFPEVTRRLVDAGADVVCIPAEWVRGPLKEHHWRTLVTARALENTIFVAAADHTPPIGVGTSLIVDPMGVELAALGETEDVALAWVSRERIDAVRVVNPALALRRFAVVPR
ncbi:carbon-nitrogen hydrolase family protein [Agromyces atrinae]|uniref:Carbon-nitrogen hydrolase family protein n=1 Tax=Agromyces atrinae TaxID=592376 RepID=A0A4Q2M016_9MICO|nr:carbon-nitrogen hydrolase family protein [Agromyces atrinae]NYD65613.1 putative amidohydrolase [Agromyces atrinae]RXZ84999.1 carbon-nitrogen hydrolase family protein [Agromyces atrinae]